jgi:hypothetical protein
MTTAKRKYQLRTFWLMMFGAIAKNIPMDVRSQANQPLVRTSALGYWISRAEIRKLVDPCCTPGTTETCLE